MAHNRKLAIDKTINPKKVDVEHLPIYKNLSVSFGNTKKWIAFYAARCGDMDVLYSLVLDNPGLLVERESDFFDERLLHVASECGQADCVKVLLQLGADVNFNPDPYGDGEFQGSALHNAVEHNQIVVVQLLLNAGASVAARKKGFTPLHFVKDLEIAKLLIEKQADVNDICDKPSDSLCKGNSVLHSVIYQQVYSASLLRFLIMKGADVHAKNISQGRAPLHILCAGSWRVKQEVFFECLNVFLCAGANPLLKDNEKRTSSDVFRMAGPNREWMKKMELAVKDYIAFTTSIKALRQVGQYSDCLFTSLPDELNVNIATFSTESNLLTEETKIGIAINSR